MDLREFIAQQEEKGRLLRIKETVSKQSEAAGLLKQLDGQPVLLEKMEGGDFPVLGNPFSSKQLIADYFGIKSEEIIPKMINAIDNLSAPEEVSEAPAQEVVVDDVDLDKFPILFHCEKDGSNYIASGVMIAKDAELGQNVSFHRAMQIGKNKFVVRILQRNLMEFINRAGGKLKVSFCVGNPVNILLAAATSLPLGTNELELANALQSFKVVKSKNSDILIPAQTEIVFEGYISLDEKHDEGPFVDLTEMYDIVRQEPVFTVEKITHRKDAMYHALLPGCLEHKLLMGMPREPTIFKEVNNVAKCLDVSITPGGCSWLHAAVKIKKEKEEDGKNAIEAAFKGHTSLKHAFIVDDDIDILDPVEIEWAMATRFQADKDLVIKEKSKGSSLDPSADPKTRETTKVGFDLTKPLVVKGKSFEKADFPKVDLKKFVKGE
jgi:UbiD family decarboxylase